MFKGIIIALAMMSTLPAFGASILGKWQVKQEANGLKFTMTLAIEQNVTHATNQCEYQGKVSQVGVSVPSKFDATTYSILGSAENSVNTNGLNCNVSARPMTVNYQVSDTQLIMNANGQNISFTRVP